MSNETEIAETETPVTYSDFIEQILCFAENLPTKDYKDCTPEEREINDDINLIIGFVEGLQLRNRDKTIPYVFDEQEHWDNFRKESEEVGIDPGELRF